MKGVKDEQGIVEVFYESTKELYVKYIDATKAMLEINIRGKTRTDIQAVFADNAEKIEMKEVLSLIGIAQAEILSLLTESAIRYSHDTSTPQRLSLVSTSSLPPV